MICYFFRCHLIKFIVLEQLVPYVCRPLSGKHKTTILCVLCDSNERSEWAVKKYQVYTYSLNYAEDI